MQLTLLVGTLFAFSAAGVYAYLALRLQRRVIASVQARLAWRLFIVWWCGLAGTTAISGIINTLAVTGVASLPLYVTLTYINVFIICAALWGLLYYLLYLFTGSDKPLLPLGVFYTGYFLLLIYWIAAAEPISIEVTKWSAKLAYQQSPTGPFFALILTLLVFPQIFAGLAYFTLFFRVKDFTQKYRILLVSWSVIIWFGAAYAASISAVATQDWWQLLSRLIGLVAALCILAAYNPPSFIKHRYGVLSLGEESFA